MTSVRNEPSSAVMRKWAVLIPILLALAIIWRHYHLPGITADGVSYLQIARNILFGKGLGWQASWVPPLHSILIAAVSWMAGIRDLLAAAGIVSSAMFFCLVLAVYYLALELFDLRTALLSAIFTALFPHLLFIAFYPEAEITYTFFLTLSLFLFARTVIRGGNLMAIAAGVSFAFAWMARSEGFVVMGFVFACAVLTQGRRFYRTAVFRYCLLSLVFFVLTASPYLLFLKKQYGGWVISPKSTYVMIWMKSRIYHDNDKGEMGNEELWGLTPDGSKLLWQVPKGISDLAGYLMSHPRKSLDVYLHNLGMEVPGRIPNNSGMENYPQLYPVYFALAALLAVFMPWGDRAGEKRAVLLAPLLILLALPVFTEGWWKYMIPYLPVVIILAARGFSVGAHIVGEKISSRHAERAGAGLLALTAVAIGARFVFALHPFAVGRPVPVAAPSANILERRVMADEDRKAGQWGAQWFGPGKNYMAPWGKIIYYLDGFWTAFPVADYGKLLDYARRNGVDYLVVELVGAASTAGPGIPPYGLELAGVYRSDRLPYSVAFYRVVR
jgi:4-amino-4-deoxy-L-arabinose transferase-like glycosyltransferase